MRVKNWERFQHFRDRRPPWIKLYRDLLDDIEWHELDADAVKVLVMIWLIAAETDGELPQMKELAFRLRITQKSLESSVSKLSHWLEQDDIRTISERYQGDAGVIPLTRSRETEIETEIEEDGGQAPASAQRKTSGPPKRAHAIPEGFTPNEASREAAKRLGISWEAELPAFIDFHTAKGTVFRCWDAGFRTWLNNAKKFGRFSPAQKDGEPQALFRGAI